MKQYPFGPSRCYSSFRDFVDSLKEFGVDPAISYPDANGKHIVKTYREFAKDIESLRKTLKKIGIARKRAVIIGENSYEWIVVYLAVVSAGGIAILFNTELDDATIEQEVKRVDGEYVFASSEYADLFDDIFGTSDKNAVLLLDKEYDTKHHTTVAELINQGYTDALDSYDSISPDDDCTIVFTSGTSSKPKAVRLSHDNLLSDCSASVAITDLGLNIYTPLPFFHAYGLNSSMLRSLSVGAKLSICGQKRLMINEIFSSGASTCFAVPLIIDVIYNRALDIIKKEGMTGQLKKIAKRRNLPSFLKGASFRRAAEKIRNLCFGNIKIIVVGGAYSNEEIIRNLEVLGIRIYQGYGITECSPLISVNRPFFYEAGTVGTVLPIYDVKFIDGEVRVKGSGVMKGYYNDPEATAAAFDKDGWFRTGDYGCRTKMGNLKILGRMKNLIVFKNGKKVSPESIEVLLSASPLIAEVKVSSFRMGKDKDDVGITASVYPDPVETRGMSEIEIYSKIDSFIKQINETMPNYEQIRTFSIRDTAFERTATGKIKETEN